MSTNKELVINKEIKNNLIKHLGLLASEINGCIKELTSLKDKELDTDDFLEFTSDIIKDCLDFLEDFILIGAICDDTKECVNCEKYIVCHQLIPKLKQQFSITAEWVELIKPYVWKKEKQTEKSNENTSF